MNLRLILLLCIVSLFAGCATYAGLNYDVLFGPQLVRERTASAETQHANFFQNKVKPIVDNRCVVCHACYDAPCQLKLSSVEGIDRGATKSWFTKVHVLLRSHPPVFLKTQKPLKNGVMPAFTRS